MKKFFLADWHYGHANIIAYDNRPFRSLEEMNAVLVDRWNHAVGKGDLVYILGDMFWCKSSEAIPVLQSLNGQKILIRGNHDRVNDTAFRGEFAKITDYAEVDADNRKIVLCHYPIPCFKNHLRPGWSHLYGHVHSSYEYNITENSRRQIEDLYEKPCRMYNVGVMMPWMDYMPRTYDEIAEGFREMEEASHVC